jgi:hypothetical protein
MRLCGSQLISYFVHASLSYSAIDGRINAEAAVRKHHHHSKHKKGACLKMPYRIFLRLVLPALGSLLNE